jgi:hypothetical protein
MADFDPADLDISEIRARLKAISRSRAGAEPRNPLPIDKYVTDLSHRPRAPKLRPAHELTVFQADGCPYLIARDGTSHAAFHAHYRTFANEHRVVANEALKSFAKDARKVRNQMTEMYRHIQTILQAQENAYDPDVDPLSLLERGDHLFRAISTIEQLQQPVAEIYRRRSQGSGNVWRISFTAALFRPWWVLTGRDPSATEAFYGFLDAAWDSLSDHPLPELDWESAISTAKLRLEKENGLPASWKLDA